MNIKQKLTWAFAAIACLPVILVAVLVVLNLREGALANFLDSSGREIRQIDNGMKQFFDGISQNVDFVAKDPRVVAAKDLKSYAGADAAQIPLTQTNKELLAIFDQFAKSHPTTAYLSLGLSDGGLRQLAGRHQTEQLRPTCAPLVQSGHRRPRRHRAYRRLYWAPDDVVLIGTVHTVADASGNILGVVGLDVSLKQLTELVRNIKLGDSGYLMLVEGNGNVLVDPSDAKHNFKPLAELGPNYAELAKRSDGVTQIDIDGVAYMANVVSSKTWAGALSA
ncbi:cache domain-containing protein [Pseudomonas sp. S3_A03]